MLRALAILLMLSLPVFGQTNVHVELDDVTDNRMNTDMFTGSLELRVKVDGTNMDKATAARVLIKEARDDKGNDLAKDYKPADFFAREYNNGALTFSLTSPARNASKVKLKGSIELYVPSRDPGAMVKIEKALSKPDAPLSSKTLKAAKVDITLLSRDAYVKKLESRKIDDSKAAAIREEGKKHGADPKEVEMMIELAKALQDNPNEIPANAILLAGSSDSFARVYRIDVLGSDGKPIDTPQRSTSTQGGDSIMTIIPAADPPPNASMQLYLLTPKSKMSTPFELTVELP
ncbi:MAG TPA: hypothetical protein VM733_00160 [Thermoanaerobaculia bacterium]|nr:hypothetical protein [Thermoanaerobaculia bacterium]